MNYVVAIPLDRKLAEFIGKGGAEGSIDFYNRKVGNDVVVGLAPSSIEDKFYAVPETMLICDQVLISTSNIDKLLGEMLVACSLLDKHVIFTDENDISGLLSGIKIADYEISPREEVLQKILAQKAMDRPGEVRIDLDHAFPVKGIGSVALGVVTRGTVKVHDELYHSSGRLVGVKSIQSQDVDVELAGVGTRVGLALKGLEHSEIEKGDILTKSKAGRVGSLRAQIHASQLAKEQILAGSKYSLVSNFSCVNATIENASGSEIAIKLEKAIPLVVGDEFLLMREKAPRIFAKGKVLAVGI
ncbi:MAG: hypothetical protein KGH61_03215 [Candidatus Micrarchaeota archaeon]|nr:hypothetical protein [Candidatus Micrarchaeota archaeon]MDE1847933.1 hypothetical protein [Candidatus Micrarchaeota archaeon]MDE1864929.1 hypothetical protein [Candidatus Micrarchaeota archaeon]